MPSNEAWINPNSYDYTQSPSALANPGYSKNNNRYVYERLRNAEFQALAGLAIGIEGRLWVCPDPVNQTLAALSTTDFNLPCEPNTWIYALNAVSNPAGEADAAGFLIQIIDSLTGGELFSQPTRADTFYAPAPNTEGAESNVLFFIDPRLYVPPSYPIVRIINLSDSEQVCLVNLFCAIETDVQPIP